MHTQMNTYIQTARAHTHTPTHYMCFQSIALIKVLSKSLYRDAINT